MEMLLKTKLNNMNSRSLVKMLAVCPALAVTTTCSRALIMCLALTFTLTVSEIIASAAKRLVAAKLRSLFYLTVTAFSASVAQIGIRAMFPVGAATLGVYLSVLAVSCIVVMRIETWAVNNSVASSFLDALICSGEFSLIMLAVSFIRELFGAGTLFAGPDQRGGITVFSSAPLPILCSSAGALLLIAFGAAFVKFIKSAKNGADSSREAV